MLFKNIDPKRVAEEMEPAINSLIDQLIPKVMESAYPSLWEAIPQLVKKELYKRVKADSPKTIHKMMEEIQTHINDLLDIKALIVDALVRDKELMVDLFQKAGQEELKFIVRSGIYFGYLFGLIQMSIWIVVQPWWLLPLGGILVGYLTNWLALKIIFIPVEAKKIGPFTFQGLFLKRQKEVSAEYAHSMATEIMGVSLQCQLCGTSPSSNTVRSFKNKDFCPVLS